MATTNTVTLKLLVDREKNRVLFAEASKEFVDFLFFILSLPVGTIVGLLTKKVMVGSIGNLYESIENLGTDYMQPNLSKDSILKPKVVNSNVNVNLLKLAPNTEPSSTPKNFYRCSNYAHYSECFMFVANDSRLKCPRCFNPMTSIASLVTFPVSNTNADASSSSKERGYVKGVVTYTIMDDLVVKPMSTVSAITLLGSFNIKDIGVLEEKEVKFGMVEAVKLIKASLESKTVLTDVFLGKKILSGNA